jgi:hypothetical protein
MSSRPFTKEDFAKWNTTTSVFYVPKRLVGKGEIPQLRADFVKAIGAEKVSAVQILPNHTVRVQFKSPSIRVRYEINGLSFRGVTLTPFPAYEEVKSVFVDRAPLQMVDNYLYEALAPYGRVISVQHLTVRGFSNIKTGTRMVSMSVNIPIPAELKVAGFTLTFRYRGQLPTCYVCQEVGHTAKECPKSKKATRKQPVRKQTIAQSVSSRTANTPSQQREVPPSTSKETPASSKPPADLRAKLSKAKTSQDAQKVPTPPAPVLEEVKVAFAESQHDLRDKLTAQRKASSLAPSTQAFDMDLSVQLPKSAPPSSPMLTDFGRTVKQKPGKQLELLSPIYLLLRYVHRANIGMFPPVARRVMIVWPMCRLYQSLVQNALSILKLLQKHLDMRQRGPLIKLWMLPLHQLMQAKLVLLRRIASTEPML